jgi:glycolate oxidase iron-sulfur subunit
MSALRVAGESNESGESADKAEARDILQACVHCGFCNAVCPTYQLLGDELDGPRGRIYLIRNLLEAQPTSRLTQRHLDRCLTCRSCETTCPSGVRYGRLLDIGRAALEQQVPRPAAERLARFLLRKLMTAPKRFAALLAAARIIKPIMPTGLRERIPARVHPPPAWPRARHARRMLILDGCVQPVLAPSIDAAAARVLDVLGISLVRVPRSGCCGALSYHLAVRDEGRNHMRRVIDACWPWIEQGAEALVSTASGCGVMLKEYGHALREDPEYAGKAARLAAMTRDIAEVLAAEDLSGLARGDALRVAFQSPCTLQHGQKLGGVVEGILGRLGYELTPVANGHLCCGSAGTYSLLQRDLSDRLLDNKLEALQRHRPDCVVTANIGCLMHLQGRAGVPVRHWIELLADHLPPGSD